jgi:hypothetical protein
VLAEPVDTLWPFDITKKAIALVTMDCTILGIPFCQILVEMGILFLHPSCYIQAYANLFIYWFNAAIVLSWELLLTCELKRGGMTFNAFSAHPRTALQNSNMAPLHLTSVFGKKEPKGTWGKSSKAPFLPKIYNKSPKLDTSLKHM